MTRATEADIAQALSIANAAVLQAEAERDHWRRAAGLMQAELRALVGIWLTRTKRKKLTITQQDFDKLNTRAKLYVGNPDPGVRQYELREGKEALMPESNIIFVPGSSGNG